jgi:hypothetical protein
MHLQFAQTCKLQYAEQAIDKLDWYEENDLMSWVIFTRVYSRKMQERKKKGAVEYFTPRPLIIMIDSWPKSWRTLE